MDKFIKGMDISTLVEMEKCGAKYYDYGKEGDLFDILKSYGINAVRIRLWNDPYDSNGMPYGAGTNDLETMVILAKRAKAHGMDILLDLHYSDFWADPGKQFKPKAWEGLDAGGLCDAVYNYTAGVMNVCKDNGILPDMVQTGNELSNGMLWPDGQVFDDETAKELGRAPEYDNLAKFVSAGIRGVKAVHPGAKIMIHLDNGGNNGLYRRWFDNYIKRGEDFDVIGLSYYPFWHGTLNDLSTNMADIAKRYGKELIVAEVSMGFTMEDYKDYEKLPGEERKGMATRQELVDKIEYPMTKEGQAGFLKDLLDRICNVPDGLGAGFYYWEPAWIPLHGSGWATKESLEYIKDPGPCGNEWANQALFDYNGNALPALKLIRDYKPIRSGKKS
ncbi:MAG: glycosyl hydrolase 53 family protein [Lachnospiraceae bacterium]|nr:glycosyl hydrolase 53 family protein [Lachnospiraceae bacterium]